METTRHPRQEVGDRRYGQWMYQTALSFSASPTGNKQIPITPELRALGSKVGGSIALPFASFDDDSRLLGCSPVTMRDILHTWLKLKCRCSSLRSSSFLVRTISNMRLTLQIIFNRRRVSGTASSRAPRGQWPQRPAADHGTATAQHCSTKLLETCAACS